MKNRSWIYMLMILGMTLVFTTGCKKDENIPTAVLSTAVISDISFNSAVSGGNLTSDGGSAIIARGVCWSKGNKPTISDSITIEGAGVGIFSSTISNLTPNTTYFVRAYATNSSGTSYGMAVSFTTLPEQIPILTTTSIIVLDATLATCGGDITSDGGSAITVRGVCYSMTAAPTIADSKTTDGTGTGVFTSSITGLEGLTTYYIRAYATNSKGTAYGAEIAFKTLDPAGEDGHYDPEDPGDF